jgi:hypothetical protein
VAEGILAISQCGQLTGGTFHIDSEHEVAYEDILDELARCVRPLTTTPAASVAELLARYAVADNTDVALGRFWAGRQPRNVRFDHSGTHRLLANLGVAFPPLSNGWLHRYIAHLATAGGFGPVWSTGDRAEQEGEQ